MPDLGRTMVIKRRTTFKVGLVVGAAAMYLLDPERGTERRARLRERLVTAPGIISRFFQEMWGATEDARARIEAAVEPPSELTRSGDWHDHRNDAWSPEDETADLS